MQTQALIFVALKRFFYPRYLPLLLMQKVGGTREGIEVEVLIRRGEIWTGYPVNVPRNP